MSSGYAVGMFGRMRGARYEDPAAGYVEEPAGRLARDPVAGYGRGGGRFGSRMRGGFAGAGTAATVDDPRYRRAGAGAGMGAGLSMRDRIALRTGSLRDLDVTPPAIIAQWQHQPAFDSDRRVIGVVDNVFVDDTTGRPTWAAIFEPNLGRTFVPLRGMRETRRGLEFAYPAELVWNAPDRGSEMHLHPGADQKLRDYYGLEPLGAAGGLRAGAPVRYGRSRRPGRLGLR